MKGRAILVIVTLPVLPLSPINRMLMEYWVEFSAVFRNPFSIESDELLADPPKISQDLTLSNFEQYNPALSTIS